MAKKVECGKFLVIECSAREIYIACGGWGICDNCSSAPYKGYYIAVLNRWFCPECYEDWKEEAEWFHEDADIERKNYEFYAPRLGLRL